MPFRYGRCRHMRAASSGGLGDCGARHALLNAAVCNRRPCSHCCRSRRLAEQGILQFRAHKEVLWERPRFALEPLGAPLGRSFAIGRSAPACKGIAWRPITASQACWRAL